ncbi:UNVERIFIED_CONTAM: hypothetical protein RMT77_004834 [Armadillidium vulgare]|uniref:Uncharacterized protein n=1 Tax=Armadillidium vulgare clopovirus TaxID=2984284 RepID=A0A9C7C0F2_9VIRU|nr:MAG: hypothetical protein [Armadillidium vulgare clopovirus]
MYRNEYYFENQEFKADKSNISLSFKCQKNGTHSFAFVNETRKRFTLNIESLQQVLKLLKMFSSQKEERTFRLRVPIEENARNLAAGEKTNNEDDFEVNAAADKESLTPQRIYNGESKKKYIYLTMTKYQYGKGVDKLCLQDKGYKFYLDGRFVIQNIIDMESDVEKFILEFKNYQKILNHSEESFVKFYTNVRIEEGRVEEQKRFLDTSDEDEEVYLGNFLRNKRMMNDFKFRLSNNISKTFSSSSEVRLGCIIYILTHRDHQFNKLKKMVSNNKKTIKKCVV